MLNNKKKKKWILESEPEHFDFQKKFSPLVFSELIYKILLQRGFKTADEAQKFLYPKLEDLSPPLESKILNEASDLVTGVIKRKDSICIYGDYDVDGVSASAILFKFLTKLGARVSCYIPDRFTEGYGLNQLAVETICKEGVKLLITVDCGVTAFNEIKWMRDNNMKVIVTDHHKLPLNLPEADAIIHPAIKDCGFQDTFLSGAGVAYYFLIILRRKLIDLGVINSHEIQDKYNLKQYLDLVALATVADVVPLKGENRILVKEGLNVLEKPFSIGLSYLKELAGVNGRVSTYDISYRLAPRLNAGGRMGSATRVLDLLLEEHEDKALSFAKNIHMENISRKNIQDEMMRELLSIIESKQEDFTKSIILSSPNWHEGVLGICAGKLAEKYSVPTILLVEQNHNKDVLKGSARSIKKLDIYTALSKVQSKYNLLDKFGGHEAAAGLSLRKDNFISFKKAFNEYLEFNLSESDYISELLVDLKIKFDEIDKNLISDLFLFEPFGEANKRPLFLTSAVQIEESRILKDKHWKGTLKDPKTGYKFEAIAFNLAEKFSEISSLLDIVYHPEINEFQGKKILQLNIQDLRIHIS